MKKTIYRPRVEAVDPLDPQYRRWLGDNPQPEGGMPIMSEAVAAFRQEAVFGTFLAPTGQLNQTVACQPTINGNTKNTRPDQARGYRGQVVDVNVGYEVDVTLQGELVPQPWARLCAGCFGSGSDAFTSAGGAATHAMTPQPQAPSYSIEVDYDIIPGEQTLARQVAGCVVDQWQIKATNQSIAQVTASFIGQKELTPATPGVGNLLNPTFFATIQPMDFSLLAYSYKGQASTQLLDLTLSLMNHTVRVFASNGQLYVTRLPVTKREVQLTTLLDFLDTNHYTDWIGGVKTSGIVVTLTSATNIPTTAVPFSVQFTVPGLRPVGQYNLAAASDVIQQNLSWSATVSGANEISSTWVNSEAGALA